MGTIVQKDDFGPVILEIQRRERHAGKLKVVKAPRQGKGYAFGVPGSMTAVICRSGSGALREFQAALKEGGAKLNQLHDLMMEQYRGGRSVSGAKAAKAMVEAPVLADVRYGGSTLNSAIFLPPHIDYAVSIFPYNGGRLAPEGFQLVQYPKDGSSERLEGIIVAASPELTPAEAAALRLVPASQLGGSVGTAASCETTYWAVGAIVGGMVAIGGLGVVTVLVTATERMQLGRVPRLSETEIKKLGPAASARKLLGLRREALLESRVV